MLELMTLLTFVGRWNNRHPHGPDMMGFRDMGVSENRGYLIWVLIIRILLFRVLYYRPLFSETPI